MPTGRLGYDADGRFECKFAPYVTYVYIYIERERERELLLNMGPTVNPAGQRKAKSKRDVACLDIDWERGREKRGTKILERSFGVGAANSDV